ncbi:GAF domain-containing protein [Hydrogenophaga sp.]|uniref:GAF domain-containing protein n=1 Tax=Hydrogenophaga sp. TaxID=1904254 RepID=UPI002724C3D4|nr:GAF domain-containing protein [Hydrogenophaga sp.]MDO9434054.1 GAF domain-containing protein [Hydrogenophaga sp.]
MTPPLNPLNDLGYKADDLTVQVTELLVATSDTSDILLDKTISDVLRLLRERMKMDVVFVSEFTDGQRVFRHVSQAPDSPVISEGGSEPLERSWCQRVVDGRLPGFIADASEHPASAPLLKDIPFPIGTHISTPIVMDNGDIYGTLCCFSFHPVDQPNVDDLKKLEFTARLAAQKLEQRRVVRNPPETVPDWQLKPK